MSTSEARLERMEKLVRFPKFRQMFMNVSFWWFCENRQDRDRTIVIQISGNSFCFKERNYFSSLECGWKNILLYAYVSVSAILGRAFF